MQSIFKVLMQVSFRVARTCTRSCKDLLDNFSTAFRRSSHEDLYKINHAKILLQKNSPGSPQDLLIGACTRSCKDLLDRASPGSPQDILTRTKDFAERTSPGFPEDLLKRIYLCKIMQGLLREHLKKDLHNIFPQGPVQDHAKTS
jgi:hypothetical protein